MDLSIIIVNWNSASYLRSCLSSIYRETKDISFEVIVVDNASYDRAEKIVKDEFKDVIFVQSHENLGFAGANNLGFQSCVGRNVLFLNPDTEVIGNTINLMVRQIDLLPRAGVVGCKLLNSDLSIQTNCIQRFPTLLNHALCIEHLRLLSVKLKFWSINPLFSESNNPKVVEAVSGASLMIKHRVFEEVDLFSTDYFMYSEDIDLCYKVKERGYLIYYVGEGSMVHHGGTSSRKRKEDSFSILMMKEATTVFLKKTRGRIYTALYKVTIGLSACSRLAIIGTVLPFVSNDNIKNSLKLSLDKWKKILRWSIGLESWAQRQRH